MRATQHFDRGLLLSTPKEKKIISKKHTEMFLEFFFLKKVKQEREKLFTRESSPQVKEEREIFWVFF